MGFWAAARDPWTPVAVADATNFVDTQYDALQGGTAAQRSRITEIYMAGLASANAPAPMIIARDSTIGVTLTSALLTQMDPATAVLTNPLVHFNTSTTKPQRSATQRLLSLGFNAFGSIVRWMAQPGQEIGMAGNTAALGGEVSMSVITGGTPGLMSHHWILETL